MLKQHRVVFLTILLIATLSQIATDVYTPSLPAIAHYFNVAVGASQYTMTLFIFGVAFTSLIYGPLSEVLGRKRVLIIGISIGIVGALMCLFATSIHMLQIGRFIQGSGLGACAALTRSVFRDTFSGDELASISSYFTNVVLLSVILAPILGGYFEQHIGWRASFAFLMLWSIVVIAVVLLLFKETSQSHSKDRLKLGFIVAAYKELLSSRLFMGYTFCAFLTYGGLFAWVTSGPVVLIHGANIKPVIFGWLSVFTGAAMAVAGTINGRFVKRVGSQKMMQMGWGIMLLAGSAMLASYYIWGLTLLAVLIPTMIFIFGSMLIFPNSFANAFAEVGHIAGYAGALYSAIQVAGGVLFSAILSHLSTSNPVPMASMYIASAVLAWLVYFVVAKA